MRRFQDVNYYAVLGVPSTASRDEIKAAYRAKVRTAHPDRGGDHDEFARVAEAWEVLGNESSRDHYDADRRLAARASKGYMTRLDRDADDEPAGRDGSAPSASPEERKAAAARREAATGASDAQRWLRNKRRF